MVLKITKFAVFTFMNGPWWANKIEICMANETSTVAVHDTSNFKHMPMGVGEQHGQGRRKWISVRQNSLSYTLQRIDYTIFIIKMIKS